jgi:hypothetical protein
MSSDFFSVDFVASPKLTADSAFCGVTCFLDLEGFYRYWVIVVAVAFSLSAEGDSEGLLEIV